MIKEFLCWPITHPPRKKFAMIMFKQNSLSSLSDSELIQRLDNLVKKERQTTLDILCHIIEMDRRSLYLGRGYASLYEYCTRHLG